MNNYFITRNNEVIPYVPIGDPLERRNTTPYDYIMFLQEYEDNIDLIEDDPINSSQAMCSYNSQKWIDGLKEIEMSLRH
ncbi:hypothetical protein Lal_00047162 [Lupinus albus]|nr:hypothetical protein Lal_00047162 [Lupinus albus]